MNARSMTGRWGRSVVALVVALGCGKDPGGPPPSEFDITLRFLQSPTPQQTSDVQDAADRWEQVITGDVSALAVTATSASCGSSVLAQDETVDDLLIWVRIEAIDGAGGVLGQGGPCTVRASSGLPAVGMVILDADDMSHALMPRVIIHEVGHALGFGTVWNNAGLLTDGAGPDPIFTGTVSIGEFNGVGGSSYSGRKVPLENTGGSGTRDSHWRDSVFGRELMTGFLNSTSDPLSVVTVGSMADLGYAVNLAGAEAYDLPAAAAALHAEPAIALGDDLLRLAIVALDARGNVVPKR